MNEHDLSAYPTASQLKARAEVELLNTNESKEAIDAFYASAMAAKGEDFNFDYRLERLPPVVVAFLESKGFRLLWNQDMLVYECDFGG